MAEAAEKKEFKRHFPRVNKCYCCCCMDLETAIKVCSYIIAILNGIVILYHSGPLINVLMNICVLISIIFLLIGISKKNISYMKQFIYVYLISIILEIITSVYSFVTLYLASNSFEVFSSSYSDTPINVAVDPEDPSYNEFNTVENTLLISFISTVVGYVIGLGLDIYYYIATGSYIEQVEEELLRAEEVREVENNSS